MKKSVNLKFIMFVVLGLIILTGFIFASPFSKFFGKITGEDITGNVILTTSVVREECEASHSNCYISLRDWESARERDLVASDEIEEVRIEGAWNNLDTASVTIDGWTTDEDHYIRIYTATDARHNGEWDTSAYRMGVDFDAITVLEANVRIEGLQIEVTPESASAWKRGIVVPWGNTDVEDIRISNNIIKIAKVSNNNVGISFGPNDPDYKAYIWNNIVYGFNGAGNICMKINGDGTKVYNNVVFDCNTCYYVDYIPPVLKNNIAQNCVTGFSGYVNTGSDYNIAPDDTATGANSKNSATVLFKDFTNDDFHLSSSDTVARNAGVDLSSDIYLSFSEDIDGETRTGMWDIGADEIVGAPTEEETCTNDKGCIMEGNFFCDLQTPYNCITRIDGCLSRVNISSCPSNYECVEGTGCIEQVNITDAVCGNNIKELGELCDGTNITETCISLGYKSGDLKCLDNCLGYEILANCILGEDQNITDAVCGNNIKELGELCDGTNITETCISLGYKSGDLKCFAGCSGYDTINCEGKGDNLTLGEPEHCSDNLWNGDEKEKDCGGSCESCETKCGLTRAYFSEELIEDKKQVSLIVESKNCDGKQAEFVIEEDDGVFGSEEVKKLNTEIKNGKAVVKWDAIWEDDNPLPFFKNNPEYTFTAKVNPEITSENMLVVTEGVEIMVAPVCGNNITEPGEACDIGDLNGYDCSSVAAGFNGSGTLSCKQDCSGYDVTQCAQGNVIDADSCEQADVQNAVKLAKDGDTVMVPEGDCTWSSRVSSGKVLYSPTRCGNSKNIVLKGAGIDKTNITGIVMCNEADKPFRITGFTFKATSGNSMVGIMGESRNWRVDHNKFIANGAGHGIYTAKYQVTYGLVDHNIFIRDSNNGIQGLGLENGASAPWGIPISYGTADFVYIENNVFDFQKRVWNLLDGDNGARFVFRYNDVKGTILATHGLDSGDTRSVHSFEIYKNNFSNPNDNTDLYAFLQLRGGTGLIYDNTINGFDAFVRMLNQRSCPGKCSACNVALWGWCNGTNSLDGNLESNGYPCMDQVGRTSDADGDGIQDSEPLYAWNNTFDGTLKNMSGPGVCDEEKLHIKEGRDFINGVKSDYVPYVYPHPLAFDPEPVSDTTPPNIRDAPQAINQTTVKVVFSENVETVSASDETNYNISDGIIISNALLTATDTITLITSNNLQEGITYTLTVNNVNDTSTNTILRDSVKTFRYTVPVSGLIAWWKFDEVTGNTLFDATGNGNDGVKESVVVRIDGKSGNALAFGGTVSQYLALPNTVLDGLNDLSVEFWANTTGTGDGVVSGANSVNDNEFLLYDQSNLQVIIQQSVWTSSVSFSDGAWHHIIITRKGSEVKIYKDGLLEGSTTSLPGGLLTIDAEGLIVGQEQDSVGSGFTSAQAYDGALDEVAIYNQALTAEEVLDKFNGTSSQTCADQNGFICTVDEYCPGNELQANDTNNCCDVACEAPYWNNCSDCGTGLFNVCDRIECDSITEECYFIDKIFVEECNTCSSISSCEDYQDDQQTCINNSCGLTNCEWDGSTCITSSKTCAEQGGNTCLTTQMCSTLWLDASDTELCCSDTCTTWTETPFGIAWAYYPYPGVGQLDDLENTSNDLLDLGIPFATVFGAHRKKTEIGDGMTDADYDFSYLDQFIREYGEETKTTAWVELGPRSMFNFTDGKKLKLNNKKTYIPYCKKCKNITDLEKSPSFIAWGEFLKQVINYTNSKVPGWKVKYWGVWREPHDFYFEAFANNSNKPALVEVDEAAKAYADLVQYTYLKVKEIDPEAKIIFGGPSSKYKNNSGAKFYKKALNKLSNRDSYGYFDYFNFHNYQKFDKYNVNRENETVQGIQANLLEPYGFGDKPIMIKEGGTYSGMDTKVGKTGNETKEGKSDTYQTEEDQANYLIKRFVSLIFIPEVKSINWYTLREHNALGTPGFADYIGLRYNDFPEDGACNSSEVLPCPDPGYGIKKLSYYSYKLLNENLNGSDWDNIEIVINGTKNVYAYKFVQRDTGELIYVAWWDWWNSCPRDYSEGSCIDTCIMNKGDYAIMDDCVNNCGSSCIESNKPIITLDFGGFDEVKVTEAIPKYIVGNEIVDYSTAFNIDTLPVTGSTVEVTLDKKPVFVERAELVNCTDGDSDGYNTTTGNGCGSVADCNDKNNLIYPGATEICSNGIDEDCDSQIDEGCIIPLVCNLTNAYWSVKEAFERDSIILTVEATNCENKLINFTIKEDDIGVDDDVKINPKQALIKGNMATATWIAEYQTDLGTLPEYYFIAILNENSSINFQSDLLTIRKSSGDGDNDGIANNIDCNDNDDSIGQCLGCAVCSEDEILNNNTGTCVVPAINSCPVIKCPPYGKCGAGSCNANQMAIFDIKQQMTCNVNNNIGRCSKLCIPVSCIDEPECLNDKDGDGIPDAHDYCNTTYQDLNDYGYPRPIFNKTKLRIITNINSTNFTKIENFSLRRDNIAKVDFLENIKLFKENLGMCEPLNFSKFIDISLGKVEIKSGLNELNKSAVITMYNVSLIKPYIVQDGVRCLDCEILSYSDGVLIFIVSHFTRYSIIGNVVYEVQEEPSNDGGDDSGGGGGGSGGNGGDRDYDLDLEDLSGNYSGEDIEDSDDDGDIIDIIKDVINLGGEEKGDEEGSLLWVVLGVLSAGGLIGFLVWWRNKRNLNVDILLF